MRRIVQADWDGLDQLFLERHIWSDAHIQSKVLAVRDPVLVSRLLSKSRQQDGRTLLFVIGGAHVKAVTEILRREAVHVVENCSRR